MRESILNSRVRPRCFSRPRLTLGGVQFWTDLAAHNDWRVQRHVLRGDTRLLDPGNRCIASGPENGCLTAFQSAVSEMAPVRDRHVVILVHGIARSRRTFKALMPALRADGFRVETFGYASTRKPIAEHARDLRLFVENLLEVDAVSFVTHSMGALVVRMLIPQTESRIGRIQVRRVVKISPPNRGSRIAALLQNNPAYRMAYGPSGQDLVPGRAQTFGQPAYDFAVIAGGRGAKHGFNPLLDGDNDGTITVAETQLAGAQDNLVVPAIHWSICKHPQTMAATARFLQSGTFRSNQTEPNERN